MTRKLLLPVLAAALLAGCATYGYDYRGGTSGDYYYGQPGSDYGYYGYPYPPDYYRGYGYPGYGAPYWGGSIGYYGYYGPSWHGGHHHGGHDGHGGSHDGGDDDHQAPPPGQGQQQPDRPRPPWRDLDRMRRAEATAKLPPPAEAREASAPRMRAPIPMRPASTAGDAPRFPRVGGGRKRDAHPIPAP